MPAPLFDVFVVGAAGGDASLPSLATVLAARLGITPTAATRGLKERKLRAAKQLDQTAAQNLLKELKSLGASALIRAATSTPVPAPAAPPSESAMASFSLAPLTGGSDNPPMNLFAPPPSSAGIDLLTGLPPGLSSQVPSTAGAPARPPEGTSGARFAASADNEPSLDLEAAPARRPSASMAGAAGLNSSRVAASSSASGLAIDSDAATDAYRVRCGQHGLFFDTRKASGCAKCLAPGRKLSAQLEDRARKFMFADFDDDPVKRAFIGLAIALVLGFVPAAYHALRMGARDLHNLRAQQEILSRKPATEEISRQFEELNDVVKSGKSHAERNTALIWVVVTGGALVGWYRFTA
jgi:hypothetical protein